MFKKISTILAAATFCLASQVQAASCTKPISVGWEDWQPYQYRDKSKLTGLDIELIDLVMQKMGCEVSYKEMPWTRHLAQLEVGKVDVAAAASVTPEREAYAYFSEPYRDEVMALYVKKDDLDKFNLNSLGDIKDIDFKLGTARGYYYGPEFDELIKTAKFKKKVEEVPNYERNVKKLNLGRLDGFLGDPVVVNYYLKQQGLDNVIVKHPLKVNADHVRLMLSKKSGSEELINEINSTLKDLKDTPEYKQVLEKYLGK